MVCPSWQQGVTPMMLNNIFAFSQTSLPPWPHGYKPLHPACSRTVILINISGVVHSRSKHWKKDATEDATDGENSTRQLLQSTSCYRAVMSTLLQSRDGTVRSTHADATGRSTHADVLARFLNVVLEQVISRCISFIGCAT